MPPHHLEVCDVCHSETGHARLYPGGRMLCETCAERETERKQEKKQEVESCD